MQAKHGLLPQPTPSDLLFFFQILSVLAVHFNLVLDKYEEQIKYNIKEQACLGQFLINLHIQIQIKHLTSTIK